MIALNGLHHVTAVTAQAQANVDFYTGVLGLRLVKRTVNQDDVSAYHLFYGDQRGNPGTELTFFDWAVGPNRNGTGSIAGTALRVPSRASLDWWAQRLEQHGVPHRGIDELNQHARLRFSDPEGQELALMDDGGAPGGEPWVDGPIPAAHAIRGLFASTLFAQEIAPTARALTEALGYQEAGVVDDDWGETHIFALDGGGAGKELYLVKPEDPASGRLGAGGVHHIAFRVPDEAAQHAWRQHLLQNGISVSHVIDRFYFHSIYFRIPGGFLFEIATDGPGFATDEEEAHLGETLALPPFLESQRAQIEANLKPIVYRTPA